MSASLVSIARASARPQVVSEQACTCFSDAKLLHGLTQCAFLLLRMESSAPRVLACAQVCVCGHLCTKTISCVTFTDRTAQRLLSSMAIDKPEAHHFVTAAFRVVRALTKPKSAIDFFKQGTDLAQPLSKQLYARRHPFIGVYNPTSIAGCQNSL